MKLDHLPKVRGENEKYLSCHHLSKISPTGPPGKKTRKFHRAPWKIPRFSEVWGIFPGAHVGKIIELVFGVGGVIGRETKEMILGCPAGSDRNNR